MDFAPALANIGWQEILPVLILVLLFFGAKRLPDLARGIGQSLNEFRKARDEFDKEIQRSASDIKIQEPPGKEPHGPEPHRPA